jgi:hypothetical protein
MLMCFFYKYTSESLYVIGFFMLCMFLQRKSMYLYMGLPWN